MDKNKLIYGLKCPFTGELHYIGKSTNGMLRPTEHMRSSHSKKVQEWVEDLKCIGQKPDIEILEYISEKEDLDRKERMWIERAISKGANLLNSNLVTPLLISSKTDGLLEELSSKDIRQISNLIKERRKAVNLTQEEFADKAGVALTVVRKIEQGKTNIQLEGLLQILAMFGLELSVKKYSKSTT